MDYKNSVVYQIYPLSFKDSNGDGIGDINGIIEELDYLKSLLVDVIWLSPVYESPMFDNGYDIANYYAVNPVFGTKEDLLNLLEKAHDKGLKVIMDLVLNHTSDEHIWFKEALKGKDSKYYDYYIWSKTKNEIKSVFGGSAWTYVEDLNQYYFHLFSEKQPDLNWQNPSLRKEMYTMINYWLDKGFDGFRLDVIDLIGKDVKTKKLADGPYLEEYLEELYEKCFQDRDVFTVGEMPGIKASRAHEIVSKSKALKMVFEFDHIALDELANQGKWALKKLELSDLKKTFKETQKRYSKTGWPTLFWTNHDQPRAVTRYGNNEEIYRKDKAKMLFTLLFCMKGTPYIYQGEEFGMTGIDLPIEEYNDIETLNIYHELLKKGQDKEDIMRSIYLKSRDNSRTPMQWDNSIYAGFSARSPWLKINPNKDYINRDEDLKDPEGISKYLKELFFLRKNNMIFQKGDFKLLFQDHESLFVYERTYKEESIIVICNFTDQPVKNILMIKDAKILLTNDKFYHLSKKILKPYFAAILFKK